MPFDPDQYLAAKSAQPVPGFDPDKYLSSKDPSASSPTLADQAQGAVEGFGNGLTFGYLPQLQAAVGSLMPDPNKEVDAKLRAQGIDVQNKPSTYLSRRDENIARQADQAKQMPVAHYGGEVAGMLAGGGLLGAAGGAAGLAAAGSKLGRVAQAAGTGAALAAAQNPGDVAGQIDPVQGKERLSNAKTGAIVGGLLQGGGELVKAGVKTVGDLANVTEKQVADALEKYGGHAGTLSGAALGFKHGGEGGAIIGTGAGLLTGKVAKETAPLVAPALKMLGKAAQSVQDKNLSLYDPFIKKAGAVMVTKPGLLTQVLSPLNMGLAASKSGKKSLEMPPREVVAGGN